jgi:hypothetical protein
LVVRRGHVGGAGGRPGVAWRDAFLRWFGPGMPGGITFGDWVRLLRDNHFDVSARRGG